MKICNSKQKTITIWIFSFDVFFFYWIIGDNDKKRLLIDKLTRKTTCKHFYCKLKQFE